MRKNILVVVVMLFSMTAIYASFPVKKKAVKSSGEVMLNVPAASHTEMKSISSNTIVFETSIEKDINVPKKDRWLFTKTLMKAMVGYEPSGWGIASFCCAMAGIIFPPLGILAVIFGAIGVNKKLKGLAIAGLTLGVIEILVMFAYLFFVFTFFGW